LASEGTETERPAVQSDRATAERYDKMSLVVSYKWYLI
jgi:hypothetical protein